MKIYKGCKELSESMKQLLAEQASINRTAYLIFHDSNGKLLENPSVMGIYTYMHVVNFGCIHIYVYEYKYLYIRIKKHKCVCMGTYLHIYLYLHVYVYVHSYS
jgi:thioredoxin-related protein